MSDTLPFRSKADTLRSLIPAGLPCTIPDVHSFSVDDWKTEKEAVIRGIRDRLGDSGLLAIRSSSSSEDTAGASNAGAFHSELDVESGDTQKLSSAIERVIRSYDSDVNEQILVQPMITDSVVSGVIMTRTLSDGSPYYVVNYDDESGSTESVTAGQGTSKLVYIYRGVKDSDFDSPKLLKLVRLSRLLERIFGNNAIDIEFGMNRDLDIYLFQVRPIAAQSFWSLDIEDKVSTRILLVEEHVNASMSIKHEVFGRKSTFGIMPDWNPAEMIGITPRQLSISLYRELITKSSWRHARAQMGYRKLPPVELLLLIAGRPYIDVRASMNSFLPEGLSTDICGKLVDAWIDRLDSRPELHDKIEFDVVPTVFDFSFDRFFETTYAGVLTADELKEYRDCLKRLTDNNVSVSSNGSLARAWADIEQLRDAQLLQRRLEISNPMDALLHLAVLAEECIRLGTIPFSILARHGFIAESIIRSAVAEGAVSLERTQLLKRSIHTISRVIADDFHNVATGEMSESDFFAQHGHLRPGTYDILSPTYAQRGDLFRSDQQLRELEAELDFEWSVEEAEALNALLDLQGLGIDAEELKTYITKSIQGREFGKYVFTGSVSRMLETIEEWGAFMGLTGSSCPTSVCPTFRTAR